MHDVIECVRKQKMDKAPRLDGIPMEAIVHGCPITLVLFNIFLETGYLPTAFMQAVIIRLVKCKTGDLSDSNNYRAITISTASSKLFESALLHCMFIQLLTEKHQFGFKSHHSTGTHVIRQTVDYYTSRGSYAPDFIYLFRRLFKGI